MPRLSHRPPKYGLHTSSGRGRVQYQGRDYLLPGPYGSAESLKAYGELIAKLTGQELPTEAEKRSEPKAPELISVAELVERYWAFCGGYYRHGSGGATGEHKVIRSALRPLVRMFGRTLARDFKPRQLKLLREEMIRLGWSRRYLNACVRRTKRLFKWATEEELVGPEVSGALIAVQALRRGRSQAREKPEVGPVSDQHIEAVTSRASTVVRDLITFMRFTGCRVGEALGLTVEEIDRGNPNCWEAHLQQHKTSYRDKPRVLFIGPKAQSAAAPWIAKAGGSGRVFRISKGGLRKAIHRACDAAKIPRWAPGRLRHSAATAIRKQFGVEAVQVILGHSSIGVSQVYAEVSADRGREVARLVG
jgi:integrase